MTVDVMKWTISASVLIVVVLLLRWLLGKRIGAGLRYGLWAVVLVRLLVPVSLSLAVTVPQLPEWDPPEAMREETIYVLPIGSLPLEDSGVHVAEDGTLLDPHSFGYPRLTNGGERVVRYAEKISPLELMGWVWIAGAAGMGIVLAAFDLRFTRRLRRVRRPLEGTGAPVPVYVASALPSPCLAGLLRPAVYVTEEAAADPVMLRHVLAHELTHYDHRDHLWSVLRCAALAVHWWDPLVWLAVVCSRRDGELACDEGALKRLGDGERTAYGETLLSLVTAKARPADLLSFTTTMSGGKRSLRERIQRIAQRPRQMVSAMIVVMAVLTLSVLAAFGQAKGGEDRPEEDGVPHTISEDTGDRWADAPVEQPESMLADLDHDGLPDMLVLLKTEDAGHTLWQIKFYASYMSSPTWTGEAGSAHVGWTSFYLCRLGGEDYLLQYTPWMGGGSCEYRYKLFYLTAGGGEVVVQENSVDFDLIFDPEYAEQHRYDPWAINAFMEEINALLADSEQLINTDENLLRTFQAEGRLYDSLWWLDDEDDPRDEDLTLLDALLNYADYAQDHPDDVWSSLADLLMGLTEEDILSFDGDTSALVGLLKSAERGSRFYTWDSYEEACEGAGVGEADYERWDIPLTDGSTLWLLASSERPSVLIILEMEDEAVSAFYTSPNLKDTIINSDTIN